MTLHLNTKEAIEGSSLASFNIVSWNGEDQHEGERWGNSRIVEQSKHTQHLRIKLAVL